MLLEDELGTINVVVPPPVYQRHRLVVRTASFAVVNGRLERREGVVNVVASSLVRLLTPEEPRAEIRHIEPPAERETGRADRPQQEAVQGGRAGPTGTPAADLAAVMPAGHNFGRRGR